VRSYGDQICSRAASEIDKRDAWMPIHDDGLDDACW
jgi:hypothetical protein